MSKKRGGARRTPVPQIDDEHLLDVCLSHVKKVGEAHAFAFGPYLKMEKSQAVRGGPLGDLQHLLAEFCKVSPSLEFKYSSLKACFSQVLQQYPGIKGRWPLSEAMNVQVALADAVLVVCNHARRISRDDGKFAEATRKLTNFQVEKLEAIREMVRTAEGKETEVQLPVQEKKTSKEKKVVERSSSPARSDGTLDLAEFEIPPTQESSGDELLQSAQKAKPVPNRKAALREEVAESRGLKRPAAALKKPACKKEVSTGKKKLEKIPDSYQVTEELLLMPYRKLGSCAVRVKQGRQLIQVASPRRFEDSKKMALEMKKMFEAGKSLGQVRAWKEKKLTG